MSSTTSHVIGWDIGGAHLKSVMLDAGGQVISSIQLSCQLWKGLDVLQRGILDALQAFNVESSSACHAITMTGELVDLFDSRHEGVCKIAKVATDLLGERTQFYAANIGFILLQEVAAVTENIASTNWHASASALALHVQDALFVDIGSTTTDIIAIEAGKVVSEGLSDAYRLATDSLVYTGVVRTPVMALAQKLEFEGNAVNVAAEYFASMADVYRLTGELSHEYDLAETADGRGKTLLESARRLARMIGHDVGVSDFNQDDERWVKLASTCRDLQIQQIKTAMLKQLKPNMTIIGAGTGAFLVKAIADDLGCRFMHACKPISMRSTEHANFETQHDIEVCFPAYAVACLHAKSVFIHKIKPC
jgi:(4-(4-[2-(gamma-L-glutamylamino)ethyl]phenoxymethyl)furan-2-yl)methanamine synthase